MMMIVVLGGVLRDIPLLRCALPTWEETPFLLIDLQLGIHFSYLRNIYRAVSVLFF